MDTVELNTLWKQSRWEVAALYRAVERGERVTEAINFAKYLRNSGIIAHLQRNHKNNEAHPALVIDGFLLEWEVSELLQVAVRVPESKRLGSFEQQVLNNLDVIAGHVRRIAPPDPANATASTPGGVS